VPACCPASWTNCAVVTVACRCRAAQSVAARRTLVAHPTAQRVQHQGAALCRPALVEHPRRPRVGKDEVGRLHRHPRVPVPGMRGGGAAAGRLRPQPFRVRREASLSQMWRQSAIVSCCRTTGAPARARRAARGCGARRCGSRRRSTCPGPRSGPPARRRDDELVSWRTGTPDSSRVTDDELEDPIEAQGMSSRREPHRRAPHPRAARRARAGAPVVRQQPHDRRLAPHLAQRRLRDVRGMAVVEASGGRAAAAHARDWHARMAVKPADLILADPGPARMFDERFYKRGALVLHALRGRMGDEPFFALLQDWRRGTGTRQVTTAQFVSCRAARRHRPLGVLHRVAAPARAPRYRRPRPLTFDGPPGSSKRTASITRRVPCRSRPGSRARSGSVPAQQSLGLLAGDAAGVGPAQLTQLDLVAVVGA